MGIFNRRKSNGEDKLNDISEQLKTIVTRNNDLACLFLYKTEFGGTSFIQGDAASIHDCLLNTAKQDKAFATILKLAAREIHVKDLDDRVPDGIKDILEKDTTSGVVDLPGGGKAIAIDPDNIKNMSDDDIDDIIDNMINGARDKRDD